MCVYIFDTFSDVRAFAYERRYHLRGVDDVITVFAKVVSLRQHLFFKSRDVVDTGNRYDGELAEMAIDNDGLCIGVGNHANSGIPFELVELVLEFGAEIGVFYIVDRTGKDTFIDSHHTSTLGAHVAVVIHSIEEFIDTSVFGCNAEKTSHNNKS